MQLRLSTGRIILGLLLALSLAIGGGAAVAAAAANNPSVVGGATLAPSGPAPVSTAHTNGMRHGQGSGSGPIDQILCLVACMGLTEAPSLPTPDVALALPSCVMQPHIAGCNSGDQVLIRPTSPPPRANAAI